MPQTPVRIRSWFAGTPTDRFTGRLGDRPQSWRFADISYLTLDAVDVLADLARQDDLVSTTAQEALLRSPAGYWPCTDARGSTAARNIIASGMPAPLVDGKFGESPDVGFGGQTAEELTGVAGSGLTVKKITGAAGLVRDPVTVLELGGSLLDAAAGKGRLVPADGLAVSFAWSPDPDAAHVAYESLIAVTAPRHGRTLTFGVQGTSLVVGVIDTDGNFVSSISTPSIPGPQVIAISVTAAGAVELISTTSGFYYVGAFTLGAPLSAFSYWTVGALITGSGHAGYQADGVLTEVGVWTHPLSEFDLYGLVSPAYGHSGDGTLGRLARLSFYGGMLVAGPSNASTPMAASTMTGSILDAVLEVGATEGAVVLADRSGVVRLRSRADLFVAEPALVVDVGDIEPGSYTESVTLERVVNDVTVSTTDGRSVRATDAASLAAFGRRAQDVATAARDTAYLVDRAQWITATASTPQPRAGEITYDLAGRPELVATVLALEVGDVVEVVSTLPQGLLSSQRLVIESLTESWSMAGARVSMTTSPAPPAVAVADRSSADGPTVAGY